jgi:hypothetical protein
MVTGSVFFRQKELLFEDMDFVHVSNVVLQMDVILMARRDLKQ